MNYIDPTSSGPLTCLIRKKLRMWTEDCELVFSTIKSLLGNSPVLRSPNFDQILVESGKIVESRIRGGSATR